MFEDEQWAEVAGLEHYLISTHGRVKREGAIEARKVSLSDRGTPIITLYGKDGKTRNLRQINQLVANAFLPPSHFDKETYVWHKDGDLTNCHVDNLRWDTKTRVREWNEMHRTMEPRLNTPPVVNLRTNAVYENAWACGMAEGELESTIVWKVERGSPRYAYE